MILPFSTKFKDGTPTHFIDKVWSCIVNDLKPIKSNDPFNESDLNTMKERATYNINIYEVSKLAPKRHSIREDAHDRWHAGRLIHPVINNRSKNQFQFAPTVPCKSVQKIEFKYDNPCSDYPTIIIDGKVLKVFNRDQYKVIDLLSTNDGFDSVKSFFAWFDRDFSGKIIHWTYLKY